jgi:hypothetical protein
LWLDVTCTDLAPVSAGDFFADGGCTRSKVLHARKSFPKPNGRPMNKSTIAAALSTRLGLNRGRVNALLVAASDAGVLPKARGRDVPSLSSLEAAHAILAAICDRSIGQAGQSAREFGSLQSAEGLVLADLVEAWVSGRAFVSGLQSIVVQLDPPGVSVSTGAHHFRFGAESVGGAAKQVVIRGTDLAAAILEMQGHSPEQADNAIAVGRLAAALN